ncbi:4-aminobutyrate--2-oxoglutarate transaminase [Serratia odorifera]|jgi:4-aminobutyrate aminotransferase / (S)-3-amino-2-methylpropionate transaminase / 5-aminovalerate transaminase|uniref:4-aminobutyrate transaminase n=2 Tax=Serratia odorifera TaxID=618 RepID=D4E6I0_SEROD|nr:4-aminobutyrate--2-oxoglutarate transaminase [Serratia odorifera]EFE94546.1 4-aminobutyrate transaminase [Serratia odorifera DSM 4582]MBJ2064932.1 4-aminobutyrate--2-oxoglutarate transaminase [Serratia odorifera]PNK89406.1 4-aminobutyrate--2-oxoglutarate transaminase [Serratia odorifera]RII70349.1 4-aminobutyrate--2-oxoglutarate transaminase [Serratia odorifera]VDZ63415.1 4-aminobutyrate aminotransferase GabT [Serratia odorifera]
MDNLLAEQQTFSDNGLFLDTREEHVARGVVTAHPLVIAKGKGAEVWDVEGNRYLDFVAGIGVLNVGHSHPAVVAAVTEQLQQLSHACFQVAAYPGYIELARRLNNAVGAGEKFKSVFFTSGAEAVENAVKIARAYTNRSGIVAFDGAFHGRTLLGCTLTGMSQPYKQNFGPFPGEIYRVPFPNAFNGISDGDCLQALDTLFAVQIAAERVAAIIIEPVQGDGGFLPASPAFMQALRELTQRHGIVLICDEVQTGFGRTGKMFGFQHAGIVPDLVTVAKSLGGGLPISGVVGKAEIMEAPTPGGLGGTYGGNALACAAALAVLDLLADGSLLARANQLGGELNARLHQLADKYVCIGEVRGIGFMQAVEIIDVESGLPDAALTQRILDCASQEGLLLIKCGIKRNTVRFLAPLVTSDSQLEEALHIFDIALARATGRLG